jgi:hypothetical protein
MRWVMVATEKNGQIDLLATLETPIKLRSDDSPRNVPAFEAVLLQHTRKSLFEKSIASIKFVIGQAEKYQVIKTPDLLHLACLCVHHILHDEPVIRLFLARER